MLRSTLDNHLLLLSVHCKRPFSLEMNNGSLLTTQKGCSVSLQCTINTIKRGQRWQVLLFDAVFGSVSLFICSRLQAVLQILHRTDFPSVDNFFQGEVSARLNVLTVHGKKLSKGSDWFCDDYQREVERERERDRQTDRDRQREEKFSPNCKDEIRESVLGSTVPGSCGSNLNVLG